MKINKITQLQKLFEDHDDTGMEALFSEYGKDMRSVDLKLMKKVMKARPVFAHKGTFGHVLMIAGHEGTIGAAVLSSKAALRTGCGLLTAFVPPAALTPLLVNLPEAMAISRADTAAFGALRLSGFDAIGFGPGAGTGNESTAILYYLLNNYDGPIVIDADGLTILSQNTSWFALLKSNVILTPHPGEFDRLTVKHSSSIKRFYTQISLAKETGATILLKGHHTSVVTEKGIYFNTTGNNGMATAGAGDVLTGMITSLCAQGYACGDAAVAGAWLHGFAGDIAAKKHSMHSMIASDIIAEIGEGVKKVVRIT